MRYNEQTKKADHANENVESEVNHGFQQQGNDIAAQSYTMAVTASQIIWNTSVTFNQNNF